MTTRSSFSGWRIVSEMHESQKRYADVTKSEQEDWGKEKAEYEEKIGELYKYPSNRPHIESIDAS